MAKSVQGEVDFGSEALRDYNAIRVPWFDHWLKGIKNAVPDEPRVQLFVMGENRWRRPTPTLARRARDAVVSPRGRPAAPEAPSEAEAADAYRYDPDDPVPTLAVRR